MIRRGTLLRRLSIFAENILREPTDFGSIAVTFARTMEVLSEHWQSQIEQSSAPFEQGLLSLELKFHEIDEALSELAKLCGCVRSFTVMLMLGPSDAIPSTTPTSG